MVRVDPERAAADLLEADERLRRGAELALPRWSAPTSLLFVALSSATWDLPASWRPVLMLTIGLAMLASAALTATTARARPLPIMRGWRTWILIGAIATSSYAVMMGIGLTLRSLAVPLPFTLSSVVLVVTFWLLRGSLRRWAGDYVQRVRRGQW